MPHLLPHDRRVGHLRSTGRATGTRVIARFACAAVFLVGALAGTSCSREAPERTLALSAIGNARDGRRTIGEAGCGSCHTIPGIRGANAMVGPPLNAWARRTYIAGQLPNTPDNLVRWLRNPPAIEPDTAMPMLGLDDRQARNVAAYLYTLR